MRATAIAGLIVALVLPLGGCARSHARDVQAMQAWIAACSLEPADESALEAIASTYTLRGFSTEETNALKKRLVADNAAEAEALDRTRPYVSVIEAWWVDQAAGSYVELAEWSTMSRGKAALEKKTYRSCLAKGYSESRRRFAEQVHLDTAEDYAFRAAADKSTASVRTSDGATPQLSLTFAKDEAFKELQGEAKGPTAIASAENAPLDAELVRVSKTVGWPAHWIFAATTDDVH